MAIDVEKIRKDFPIIRNGDVIYMDSACMSLRPDVVIEAIGDYYRSFSACTGRSEHKLANKALSEVEKAREIVKNYLGAKHSKEIIFTRNSTEGINFVARSLNFEEGDVVITSDREHSSNLLPWQELKKRKGIIHKIVPSTKEEKFDLEAFKEIISNTDKVKLVSIVHTSNLDGYTLPIKDVIEISHKNGVLVLVDGAQSAPHKSINLKKLRPDFFVMSSHKACGPSGMGCLYITEKILDKIDPFLTGGGTVDNTWYDRAVYSKPPEKFEAGLQDIAGICGFGKACEYIENVGRNNIEKYEEKLNKILSDALSEIQNIEIIGVKDYKERSGVLNFNIKGMDSHEVALLLDQTKNIAVRSGMHCLHSWYNSRGINGSVRISMYFYNNENEIEILVESIKKIARLSI